MNTNKILTLSISLLLGATSAVAAVKLPAIISSGMVVQRDHPFTLWGTADPGEKVTVKIKGGKSADTVADTDGSWTITLPPLKTGKTHSVTVGDITLEDILVGDVLLCSGQSNMELPIARVMDLLEDDYRNYPSQASVYPVIRQFKVPKEVEFGPARTDVDPSASWKSAAQDGDNFSALAFYTARALHEKTGLPVGLVNASWGGTPVESWVSDSHLASFPLCINKKSIYSDPAYREAVKTLENRNYEEWNRVLRESDPGLRQEKYYSPSLSDSDWEEIDLFSTSWGTDGMKPANGTHWLRKSFRISADKAGQPATLRLGCIVDADSVWVNGRQVGFTSYQYPPRIYHIPAGLLREGENNVTIQLISQHGKPHFVPEKPYKIIFGSSPHTRYGLTEPDEISLEGKWRYHRGAEMPEGPGMMFWCYLPSVLYNSMIAPVIKYPVRGAVWYQGESNVDRSNLYAPLFTALTSCWREASGNSEMPFYVVELAGFLHPSDKAGQAAWQKMRDVQRDMCHTIPAATLIPNADLGEWNDIHPLDKKTLGSRVAESIYNDLNQ